MKQIRVVCWFTDSEKFIAKLVVSNDINVRIMKNIDPVTIITGRVSAGISGEKYDIFGFGEEIDKLTEYLKASDFDVEIEERD